jgi:hyperosmotically inducible periplasmic protein
MKLKHTCAAALMGAGVFFVSVLPLPAVAQQADATTATPASMRAANRALAKAVQAKLYHQKGLVTDDVHAIARSGKVTLVGMVPDQAQIDQAGKIAEGVSGVSSVKNNLTVEEVGR